MNDLRSNLYYKLLGPVLFLSALSVYLFTLARDATPDVSSYYMVHMSGIEPRLSSANIILYIFSRVLAVGPDASMPLRLNVFDALCGALCVLLMFQLTSRFIYSSVEINTTNGKRTLVASLVGGVTAALSLAFSASFWSISNRFHIASFNVLLLLSLTRFFVSSLEKGSHKRLLVFAFLYGIATVEYVAFIPFVLLFGPYVLFWLWAREEIEPKIVIKLVVCGLAGLMFYFVSAWIFCAGKIYPLMENMNYWKVVGHILRDQYLMLTRILPDSGWLIIIMVTIVPWLTSLMLARRGLNEDPNFSLFILHLTMTALAVISVLNLSFIKGPVDEAYMQIVLPYVLSASSLGYFAAYWFLLPSALPDDPERRFFAFLRKRAGYLLVAPFVVIVAILPFLNFQSANARSASFIDSYSERVLECLNDGDWLVLSGALENNLLVKASQLGKDIKIINLSRTRNDVYLKYIAENLDNPELKAYAEISVVSMLKAWIASDPNAFRKLAILDMPDLWRSLGFEPMPDKLVFKGVHKVANVHDAYEEHVKFWNDQRDFLALEVAGSDASMYLYANCRRHMGRVANNLGVLLQDNEMNDEAYGAYKQARLIDPDNISALLNISIMSDTGYTVSDIEGIRSELMTLSEDPKRQKGLWALSSLYGYVRHPQAIARQGMSWALSGQPEMAVKELKLAEKMVPEGNRGRIKELIAGMYMRAGEAEQSELMYRQMIASNPQNYKALIGLARLSIAGDFLEKAKVNLESAEQAGAPEEVIKPEYAMLAIKIGDFDKARVIIEDVLFRMQDKVSGLRILAEILKEIGTMEELISCIQNLENQPGGKPYALMLRGEMAVESRNLNEALSYYKSALSLQNDNSAVREKILRLYFVMGRKAESLSWARGILTSEPENPFANYVLASIKIYENDLRAAETFLRRSVSGRETPEALNDLAWVLCAKGKLDEAESMARRSIELSGSFYSSWDTLGEILYKQGNVDEALTAYQKAFALFDKDYRVHVHLAEVLIAKGNKPQAKLLLDEAFTKMSLLSIDDKNKLVELRRLVRD